MEIQGSAFRRVRFETSRTEGMYNAGSLDADTNLVLNGHVPSSISLQCSYTFFFSSLILPLRSSNREFAEYTNTGFSRDLLLENVN